MSSIKTKWGALAIPVLVSLSACTSATPQSASTISVTEAAVTSSQDSTVATTAVSSAAEASDEGDQPLEGWTSLNPPVPSAMGSTVSASASDGIINIVAICDPFEASLGEDALTIWRANNTLEWKASSLPSTSRCPNQIEITPFGIFANGGDTGLWSPNGQAWEPLGIDPQFNPGFSRSLSFDAVFVSPDSSRVTLLQIDLAPGHSTIASLVTTTDGSTWEPGPDASVLNDSTITGVLHTTSGILAFGASPGGESVPTAVVFHSPDGLNWQRVTPREADFEDKIIMDVIQTGTGLVAVGGDFFETGQMTAWTSPDGFSWSRAPHPIEPLDPSIAFRTAHKVTHTNGSFWAAGVDHDASRQPAELPALWVSHDAIAWTRVEIETSSVLVPFELFSTSSQTFGAWPPHGMPSDKTLQLLLSDR